MESSAHCTTFNAKDSASKANVKAKGSSSKAKGWISEAEAKAKTWWVVLKAPQAQGHDLEDSICFQNINTYAAKPAN